MCSLTKRVFIAFERGKSFAVEITHNDQSYSAVQRWGSSVVWTGLNLALKENIFIKLQKSLEKYSQPPFVFCDASFAYSRRGMPRSDQRRQSAFSEFCMKGKYPPHNGHLTKPLGGIQTGLTRISMRSFCCEWSAEVKLRKLCCREQRCYSVAPGLAVIPWRLAARECEPATLLNFEFSIWVETRWGYQGPETVVSLERLRSRPPEVGRSTEWCMQSAWRQTPNIQHLWQNKEPLQKGLKTHHFNGFRLRWSVREDEKRSVWTWHWSRPHLLQFDAVASFVGPHSWR